MADILPTDVGSAALSAANPADAIPFTFDDNHTHALRHPYLPTQEPRVLTQVNRTPAQQVSHGIRRAAEKEKRAKLTTGLADLLAKHEEEKLALAKANFVHVDYLNKLSSQSTHFKPKRDINIENAKIHAKAKEVNASLAVGERKKLPEIRRLMLEDPKYQEISKEREEEMIKDLVDARELKKMGARITNKSAAQDYRAAIEAINDIVTGLTARTGASIIMFTSRSHLEDTFEPNWVCSENASNFVTDSLNMSMWDISRLLEQWACSKGKVTNTDTLTSMQKECSTVINGSLKMVSQKKHAAMNYADYETSVVQAYRCKLVGWTFKDFVSPYRIYTIDDIRTLLAALRSGQCHWVRMAAGELSKRAKDVEEKKASGEIVVKKRKTRSDAGVKKGPRPSNDGSTAAAAKPPAKKRKTAAKAPKPVKTSKLKRQMPPARSKSVIASSDDDSSADSDDSDDSSS